MTIVVAEVTIPSDSFELGEILHNHGQLRIELTQFVPAGNALVPYFWAETTDRATFEAAVRSDDRVAALTEVDTGPDKQLYHIEWTDPTAINGLLKLIRTHGLIVESAVGTDDTWQFRLRAPDHDSLAAFHQACTDTGIQMTVHRVWNPVTEGHDQSRLTLDQREALKVAATFGYFETPSKATLEEVGEELGISSQAASKRIRGGVEKLVTNALFSTD